MNKLTGHTNKLTDFGKEVKKKLIDLDMTQESLAEEVGVTFRYLNHILYGRRTGKLYLKKITDYLGLEVEKESRNLEVTRHS